MQIEFVSILEDGRNSFLQFNAGSMHVGMITVEGDRAQARDVSFVDDIDGTTSVDVASGVASEPLSYDVHQGTYDEFKIDFRIDSESDVQPALTLEAEFMTDQGSVTPVRFILDDRVDLELTASEAADGGEINFVEGEPIKATVELHVMDWFGLVTVADLEHAELTEEDGTNWIVISRESNENIFDLVVERIGEADKFLIH